MLKGHGDDQELYNAIMELCRYVPPLGVDEVMRRRNVVREAEQRLRAALRSTPSRRRTTRVRTSPSSPAASGSSSLSTEDTRSDNETSSTTSSSSAEAHSISTPSLTDPEGRSEIDMDDISIPMGSFSYDSDDSRSAACTSGDELD
jgi:hypothetical protein